MKHTTLTPPLKSLKIAIVSAILGLGAVSTVHAQTQNNIDTEMDKIFNMIDQLSTLSDEEKKVRKNIVRLSYGLNNTSSQVGQNSFSIERLESDVEYLAKNQNHLIEQNGTINQELEGITHELESFIAYAHAQDQKNLVNEFEIEKNKDAISKNNDSIDDLYEANNENVERLIEHDRAIQILAEAGNHHDDLIRNLYEFSKHQEEYALRQTDEIENLIQASSANTDRISTAELGIAENKKDALIAKAQADKNKSNIKTLAQAQLESVTFLGEQIQENKDDIANNINNIYELAQQQDQHSSDIKNLGKASLTNTKRIATAELGIAENKKDALIAKKQANQNKADITTNKADITKNKATLAQHTKKIDDNQRAIEAKLGGKVDAQKLVDLETKVKQNQDKVDERLTTVQENYSQLNTQVQSVDSKVGTVNARVNDLNDKVENSMAAQAALNGLFQPYNVGKVSVSAAVGAYGSKSAIAVGAGYRVNPHLAFKGGAAINTSGSRKGSYNLGINYEF